MCAPLATLSLAATAIAAVGQGVSMISQHRQHQYEARVAGQNAQIERNRGADALERGAFDERSYARRLSQEQGAQRAAMAANGIDPSFGSAADVRGDTAMFGAEDLRTIRENARREAEGFAVSSFNFQSQATASRRAASGALIGGAANMGSTILGGAMQYRGFRAKALNGSLG